MSYFYIVPLHQLLNHFKGTLQCSPVQGHSVFIPFYEEEPPYLSCQLPGEHSGDMTVMLAFLLQGINLEKHTLFLHLRYRRLLSPIRGFSHSNCLANLPGCLTMHRYNFSDKVNKDTKSNLLQCSGNYPHMSHWKREFDSSTGSFSFLGSPPPN